QESWHQAYARRIPMARSLTVLVTGSTGSQGGSVARLLLSKGHRVRALARDPGKPAARALADRGAELMRGDLEDRASIERATAGSQAGPDRGLRHRRGHRGCAGGPRPARRQTLRLGWRRADRSREHGDYLARDRPKAVVLSHPARDGARYDGRRWREDVPMV